jgi:Rrf2 family nitric oxide-sensitive transcriptional repressor
MRLSLHTDYALRVLMYLATTDELASVDRIADAFGISRNHLMKVAKHLADGGYIEAKRGRGGGLALAMPKSEISVGQVVRSMESLSGFVECFTPETNKCPIAGACGLQGALGLAVGDFLKRLDGYSLQDLVPDRNRFEARLRGLPSLKAQGLADLNNRRTHD